MTLRAIYRVVCLFFRHSCRLIVRFAINLCPVSSRSAGDHFQLFLCQFLLSVHFISPFADYCSTQPHSVQVPRLPEYILNTVFLVHSCFSAGDLVHLVRVQLLYFLALTVEAFLIC